MHKSLHSTQNAVLLSMLRQLRQSQRLRQTDLANLLGKDQATVSKVESGVRRLDILELRTWVAALDADFVAFMSELSERLAAVPSPTVSHRVAGRRCASDDEPNTS